MGSYFEGLIKDSYAEKLYQHYHLGLKNFEVTSSNNWIEYQEVKLAQHQEITQLITNKPLSRSSNHQFSFWITTPSSSLNDPLVQFE